LSRPLQNRLLALLLVCLAVTTSGCGYQLRGSASLPPALAVTYIQGLESYGSLAGDFAEALRTRNVSVTTESSAATALLEITGNTTEKLVLSVDSSGNVLEFEIRQTIRFLVTAAGQPLVDEQSLSLSRDFLFTSTDVLAKVREENIVRRTLQQNIVDLAMLRIASLARQTK